jgi:phage tail sheath protein FI
MDYKTPGVFVEEMALFPPSVASVATAVPAFVGHTAKTAYDNGATLLNTPTRIASLLDFIELFGGAYVPATYNVQVDPLAGFNILAIDPLSMSIKRYYLFDALRSYFDNGGGPCYIVSVGNFSNAVAIGDDTTGLLGGLRTLEKVDEPTLLVVPDGAALPSASAIGMLHKKMMDQCARLQDRFAIMDTWDGKSAPEGVAGTFRTEAGNDNLKYGAAYYPWLYTSYQRNIRFWQLTVVNNAPSPVPVAEGTLNTMTGNTTIDGYFVAARAKVTEEQRIFAKLTGAGLNRDNYNPLVARFETLRNAVLSGTVVNDVKTAFGVFVSFVRSIALALPDLANDTGNSAELTAKLAALKATAALRTQLTQLVAFEKNADVLSSTLPARDADDVVTDYAGLDDDWLEPATLTSATVTANATDFTGANDIITAQRAANFSLLQAAFNAIAMAYTGIIEDAIYRSDLAEKILFDNHPFFKAALERVQKYTTLLPPSGAMAGVYAAIDRTRGVWKAPANVSLQAVIAPAYKLSDSEQGALNVHETGKSINAIRAFTGKGVLVWGARTLAGNDNEWRYVNVRRFFNYVEESTKKASEPFVFESNNANTWVRIRAMIENFLTLQWRAGALAGATTKEAFYVKVGLNETMTAQDILEGRLIVEVGMAAVRPAEFIVLRFSHKMQES